MSQLRHDICGLDYGGFEVRRALGSGLLSNVDFVESEKGLKTIFSPYCNFTNRIVKFGQDNKKLASNFYRTANCADGGIVDDTWIGIGIFNADSPIIAVHNKTKEQLALLHCGFRCLIRKDTKERSIIRVLFEDFKDLFPVATSEVFIGYGIGPCCYGAPHYQPEIDDYKLNLPVGRATRGPRYGKQSIDLYQLIRNQLLGLKVPEKNISYKQTCTSCSSDYFSHCISPKVPVTNLSLAWMIPDST